MDPEIDHLLTDINDIIFNEMQTQNLQFDQNNGQNRPSTGIPIGLSQQRLSATPEVGSVTQQRWMGGRSAGMITGVLPPQSRTDQRLSATPEVGSATQQRWMDGRCAGMITGVLPPQSRTDQRSSATPEVGSATQQRWMDGGCAGMITGVLPPQSTGDQPHNKGASTLTVLPGNITFQVDKQELTAKQGTSITPEERIDSQQDNQQSDDCNNRKQFICLNCNKKYSTKFTLSRHMNVCKGVQNHFTCKHCGQKFGSKYKSKYVNHQTYCNQKETKCTSCDKEFLPNQRANLIRHQQKCSLKFKCSICNENFSNIDEYNKHSELCNYVCGVCGKLFSSKQFKSFSTHSKKCENKQLQKRNKIICTICNKRTFYNLEAFKLHFAKCKKLFCPKCSRRFSSKQKLDYHVQNKICQEFLYKYQCKKCMHVFKYRKSMQTHKLKCKLDRTFYVCQFCNNQFKTKAGLVTHLKYCKKLDIYPEDALSPTSSEEGSLNSPMSQSHDQGVYLFIIYSVSFHLILGL